MANQDAPFGLRPVGHMAGGTPLRMSEYAIPSSHPTTIYTGDAVKIAGTQDKREIDQAATGDTITGVFAGCEYLDSSGRPVWSRYWPANQTTLSGSSIKAWVYDDPRTLFEIQADGDINTSDIRDSIQLSNAGNGDTMTGVSGMTADAGNVGATADLKILGLADRPDNAFGNYAVLSVMIATHELAGSPTAVA